MNTLKLTYKNILLYPTVVMLTVSCTTPKPKQETKSYQNVEKKQHHGRMETIRDQLKKELGKKYDQPIPTITEEQRIQGKVVYEESCVSCHGKSGKGNGMAAMFLSPKPANFTDPKHSKFYSDQGRIQIIKKGIQDTSMPAWENKLNEKEIASVYAYVQSLRSK